MITIIIIIIIAVLTVLITIACCKASAQSTPYPCRGCQEEYCTECEYWREWVGDDS